MYDSFQALRKLNDSTIVYPGHSFSGSQTTIGQEKITGMLRDFSKDEWLCMQGEAAAN